MIQKIKLLGILGLMIMVSASCNFGGSKNELTLLPPGNHRAEVVEVVQASSYTYLLLDEDGSEYWIAVNRDEYAVGDVVYHLTGMEMKNFESKDLGRTFEQIYFVQDIGDQPFGETMEMVKGQTEPQKPILKKMEVEVETPEGGITIGELYANMADYDGKTVIVRGKVTKVNQAILDRNWIHIQDGSGDENHFDLTITTLHNPEKGAVVTYRGKVALNRDFGMGYSYELLLEDAEAVE